MNDIYVGINVKNKSLMRLKCPYNRVENKDRNSSTAFNSTIAEIDQSEWQTRPLYKLNHLRTSRYDLCLF